MRLHTESLLDLKTKILQVSQSMLIMLLSAYIVHFVKPQYFYG